MTETLDSFLSIWHYWMFPSFGIGIIGFFILFNVRWGKPRNIKKSIRVGAILLGQTFLTWFIASGLLWTIQLQARKELKEFLCKNDFVLKIDGKEIDSENSKVIITELRTIDNIAAHHSHPTNKTDVQIISDNETINLSLEKDSDIDSEYWVFWDKYNSTTLIEIGRIRTEKLKKGD